MEFHQYFVSFSLFIFFLFEMIRNWRNKYSKTLKKKLPPGPWRLPIIGSVHHLTSGVPHRVLQNLSQKYGPIMYLQLGEVPTVVVSSPHMAKKILKTHDLAFASRPVTMLGKILCYNCTDIAFSPYGDYWRQMRKLSVLELLSAKMVKSFSSIRQDELSNLLSSIGSMVGLPINLAEKLLWFMNASTCRSAFGEVCKDQNELITLIHRAQSLSGGFELSDLFPSKTFLHGISGMKSKLMKARSKVDVVLDNIINLHRENRANGKNCNGESGVEDLIDVFLRVMENGEFQFPLTNDNIKAVILDMFVAGSDTSSSTVIWALSEMMKSPGVMAKAQAEVRETFKGKKTPDDDDLSLEKLNYLKLVIKETLRLHPPTPLLVPRECREETEIDGFTIPLKSKVLVNVWAIGRDPESWENPDCFIPERFENSSIEFTGNHFQLLPFGAGRRICPGILFGVALVTLPLAHLLYKFDWKLPEGTNARDLDMIESNGITARRENDLYLVATPSSF
ncbi:hypothetical protein HAX54_033968 [Datura stramonium]|uniref:Cytochrome P450 n=1 Tax=Datura stramonium TaxID=4076 RepID=A0ABS8SDT1_DATST|nr:hypothetical protein [Datura stramonium]